MGLEPADLARWSRFADKGGIGKCTATCDCVAESTDDLMFMKVSPLPFEVYWLVTDSPF